MDKLQPSIPPAAVCAAAKLSLPEFVEHFGDSLLDAVREQNPPIYDGFANAAPEA